MKFTKCHFPNTTVIVRRASIGLPTLVMRTLWLAMGILSMGCRRSPAVGSVRTLAVSTESTLANAVQIVSLGARARTVARGTEIEWDGRLSNTQGPALETVEVELEVHDSNGATVHREGAQVVGYHQHPGRLDLGTSCVVHALLLSPQEPSKLVVRLGRTLPVHEPPDAVTPMPVRWASKQPSDLTLRVTQQSVSRAGFELVVLNENDVRVGELSVGVVLQDAQHNDVERLQTEQLRPPLEPRERRVVWIPGGSHGYSYAVAVLAFPTSSTSP